MSKLDELIRTAGANADESMGRGIVHGAGGPSAPPAVLAAPATPTRMQGLVKIKNAAEIPVEKIGPDPAQPREEFDEESLARLAESLKAKGQLQPIQVAWHEDWGRYVILCGERRWRAAQLAGLPSVACVIHERVPEPGELLVLQVIENCLREDLKPIEQAKAFRRLMEMNGWSARQVARELSLTQSFVARALALLDLPEAIQELVEEGTLPPATACEVGRLERREDQVEVAERVVIEKLTRDQVVAAVQAKNDGRATPERAAKAEVRLDDGHRVSVVGPNAGAGPEAVIEVLRRAIKRLQAEAHTAARGTAA